ncbi:hypothetical protein [uncultured Gammaproteobacteria bacterium]|nr:hypothetical protein [uncultured Gammaproteobacteria bacterium]
MLYYVFLENNKITEKNNFFILLVFSFIFKEIKKIKPKLDKLKDS